MKLNPDCIRDILLKLEETTDGRGEYMFDESDLESLNLKYTPTELLYHLKQCLDSGFIQGRNRGSCISVRDLTPAGHAFLADIRNDNNWNKTKEIATKVGAFSLNALKDIAVGVVSAGITASLK
ncbi:DUF2513 domain-containing protein [Fusobacterium ulcerans]|uniref:DUF2513 domain-containing protein n=1 Tax=Fusobacterium ulcerans TaxID=861 RepID=UPI000E508EB5|nr:DUF2513 domain-containing protein [Fusobacterium ulcerans]RGY66673.1 DUF2513 domain-containing protein [Fusobacterium ulcerans]